MLGGRAWERRAAWLDAGGEIHVGERVVGTGEKAS
jgi:hypothetical protein